MKKYLSIIISSLLVICCFLTGCEDEFEIYKSVDITGISPQSAYMNDTVTIEGKNFDLVDFVFVGERQAEFELVSNTAIKVIIPETAQVGHTKITLVMRKNFRQTVHFEVLLRPIPVIQSVSENAVAVGDELIIKGLSFNSEYNTSVTIDGIPATIISNDGTYMTVVVPAGLQEYQLAEIEITSIHGSTKSDFFFYAGENLILNGNFEAGTGDDFDSWEKLNGGSGITAVTDASAYYERSARVVGANNPSQPWRTQFASAPVTVTEGTEYTVVLWAKGEADGAIMRISVSQYPEDYFYGGDVNITTEWAQYSWTFNGHELPNGSKIVLDMGHTDIPFVIDNVTMIEGTGGSLGAPELLANPSFEDDMTGWMTLNGTFSITTAEAYCGSKSLEAVGTGGNHWDVQMAAEAVELTVGTDYELGFWAKAAGPDGVMRTSVSRWASGQSDDFFYSPDITVAEDWTYYSFIFTAQATSTGDHHVVFDFGSTTQTFYLDAVSLKEYIPPTSLFANQGFEDGMTDWEAWNGTAEVTSAEAYEGSNSLTATGTGGNHWDVQIGSTAVALEPGVDYKLSFWVKAAGPDGVMRASLSRWASGQSDDFFYTPDVTVPEDWAYFSWVFTAQATSTGDHIIVLDFGSTTQTFYIDEVIVVEYEDPCAK